MAISVCRDAHSPSVSRSAGEEPPMRMNCGMVLRMSMRTLLSSAGETISMSWRAGTCVSLSRMTFGPHTSSDPGWRSHSDRLMRAQPSPRVQSETMKASMRHGKRNHCSSESHRAMSSCDKSRGAVSGVRARSVNAEMEKQGMAALCVFSMFFLFSDERKYRKTMEKRFALFDKSSLFEQHCGVSE